MTKKVLYVASTEIHLRSFHIPYLKWFKEKGFEVHVAYKGNTIIPYSDKVLNIPFERSPFNTKNIIAYKKLKNIISINNYSLIHCHTPTASVITRLAAKNSRKKGTRVLYTSHGFHFYKGAPIKNWLYFFPIEWGLSFFTDAIITVNNEDFNVLSLKKFPVKAKYKINSIGVNTDRIKVDNNQNNQSIRNEMGYSNKDIIILYIAEFNLGKRHEFVLESLPNLIKQSSEIKVLFAGGGVLLEKLKKRATELNVNKYVNFLGFRQDIGKLIKITDIGISTSNREGFGLGVAEILSYNIPVVVSDIRGHNEIVKNGINGYLFDVNSHKKFIDSIVKLVKNEALRKKMGERGRDSVKKFGIEKTINQMKVIYANFI
jgi:glycosyltransferase EpsD